MSLIQKKVIVIVDAFSTGAYYPPAFVGHGYPCIHINSNLPLHEKVLKSLNKAYFIREITLGENLCLSDAIDELKKYDVKAIISGSEPGVINSEEIARHFDVKSNDLSLGLVRRDKYLMVEALREANIPCAKQIKSNKLDDLLEWYQNCSFEKAVLKPCLGALSDGVSICKSSDDIRNNFKVNHGKMNYTGIKNNEFVLQECLEGDEYIVNSVSCNDEHFITDVWRGVGGLKDQISTDQYAELLSRESKEFQELSDYTFKTLKAVGIKNSAAHSEIKMTNEGEKLIEVGARLAGGIDFAAINEAIGFSQLSLAVDAALNPECFSSRIASMVSRKQKFSRIVYLCSYIEGEIINSPDFNPIMQIGSVMWIKHSLEVGNKLLKTNENFGRPGYSILVAEDMKTLEDDYMKFRELEKVLYESITGK